MALEDKWRNSVLSNVSKKFKKKDDEKAPESETETLVEEKPNMFLQKLISGADSVLPKQEFNQFPFASKKIEIPADNRIDSFVSPVSRVAPKVKIENSEIPSEPINKEEQIVNESPRIRSRGPSSFDLSNYNTEKKHSESNSIPDEFIIAGIPLVVSALMGDIGTGAGVAGKALVDSEARKQKIADDSRKPSSSNLYKYIDENGVERYGSREDAYGKSPASFYSTMDARSKNRLKEAKGKAEIGVDAFKMKEELKGDIGRTFEGMPIDTRDFKDASSIVQRFDKYNQKGIEAVNNGKKIKSLFKLAKSKNNINAYQSAVKEYAKILEGGGRLTDFDVEMVTDRLSYIKNAEKKLWQEKTGKPNKKIINEIVASMDEIEKEYRKSIKKTMEMLARGASNDRGEYKNQKFRWLMQKMNVMIGKDKIPSKNGKVTISNGKEVYEIDANDLDDARKDGFDVMER